MNENPTHPHKSLYVILVVVIIFAVIFFVFRQDTTPLVPVTETPVVEDTVARDKKLAEISQSLTVQPQTPQFKAKLAEISKSLKSNK